MKLQEAERIAYGVIDQLQVHCTRIEVAGSIRRLKIEGKKYCSVCSLHKSLDNFHTDNRRHDKKCVYCKDCNNKKQRDRHNKNITHCKKLKVAQAQKFRDKNIIRSRDWYKKNKERVAINVKLKTIA